MAGRAGICVPPFSVGALASSEFFGGGFRDLLTPALCLVRKTDRTRADDLDRGTQRLP